MLNPLSRTNQQASPETLTALRGVGKHPEEEARDVTLRRIATLRQGVLNLAEVTHHFMPEATDTSQGLASQPDYYQEAA
jgi:hypothetical protein